MNKLGMLPAIGVCLATFASAWCSFAAARHEDAGLPRRACVDLGGGLCLEFSFVPAGVFQMGSPEEGGDGDETPQRRVEIARPYYMGVFEVTQAQWERVMGNNPSRFRGDSLPVDSVSWYECQRFLMRLSELTGRRFALPTEAQWEYACRAGSTSRWSFGDVPSELGEYAWYEENSGGKTHPVGEKRANAFGLHDLYGNVAEWCADWYANPYPPGPAVDPAGPSSGVSRTIRGGAWGDAADSVRSAYRSANGPDGAHDGVGFRCVLLSAEEKETR